MKKFLILFLLLLSFSLTAQEWADWHEVDYQNKFVRLRCPDAKTEVRIDDGTSYSRIDIVTDKLAIEVGYVGKGEDLEQSLRYARATAAQAAAAMAKHNNNSK